MSLTKKLTEIRNRAIAAGMRLLTEDNVIEEVKRRRGGESMNIYEMIRNQKLLWAWAMGWVEEAKTGKHSGVKTIHNLANQIKNEFYTNGIWNEDAHLAYDKLREAADIAQDEYENAQPGIE